MRSVFTLTVFVAALGYFVDMYDMTLFGVVRASSLAGIGITDPKAALDAGIWLYNIGLIGMMLGGILWGVLADRMGRLSVMFASIFIYSIGNILNAYVTSVDTYALCRLYCWGNNGTWSLVYSISSFRI
jgi:putative MFS transporter